MKYYISSIAAIFILSTFSCKKDLLHLQKVQQLNSNTTCQLNRVRFINDNICIAAGGTQFMKSEIVRSADGGYTWSAYTDQNAQKEMYGMTVSPNGTIYLCGIDGDVLYSKDTGNTWLFNRTYDWLVNFACAYPTDRIGIYVNSVLQRGATIVRVDGDFNLIDQKSYLFGLNNIYMTSASRGFVVGYGAVMETTDTGASWNFQDVQGDDFTAMDIHGDEIWMCGANGGIYHTTNGGYKWVNQRNGNNLTLPRYMLRSIIFKDTFNGWAVGDNGLLIYSNDGGDHWMEYDKFTTNTLRSIVLCPNGDLLIAGDNGALFRITP